MNNAIEYIDKQSFAKPLKPDDSNTSIQSGINRTPGIDDDIDSPDTTALLSHHSIHHHHHHHQRSTDL